MPNHAVFTTDKIAVITGAADGIRLAAAQRYASVGMHVLMADIDRTRLEAAAHTIVAGPRQRIETHALDVAKISEVEALKARAIICPDNEVSTAEDARRLLWAARDLVDDRPPLSRWHV